jgi:prepilin-type N-terminal cleavage/methylation domain-containing protein
MRIHLVPDNDFSTCKGFSVLEVLIVIVMILIVISFTLTSMVRFQKPALRANAARQFMNFLDQARNDSMRRRATGSSQMAQVTILNDRYYSVTVDANGDGVLDMPLVVSLVEQHVTLDGPFPRTFMFNSLGRVVDSNEKVVPPATITVANSSGASVVKLSDAGQPSMPRR